METLKKQTDNFLGPQSFRFGGRKIANTQTNRDVSGGNKCYVILKYRQRAKIHQSRTGFGEEDGRISRDSSVLALKWWTHRGFLYYRAFRI